MRKFSESAYGAAMACDHFFSTTDELQTDGATPCKTCGQSRTQHERIYAARHYLMEEILKERIRQNQQWGGPPHDDDHGAGDWVLFLGKHLAKLSEAAYEGTWDAYRRRLIVIAALATAAAESYDRRRLTQRM